MSLATSHRLGEIKRTIFALARQSIEPTPDEKLQPGGEVVAPEEGASIDAAGCEILDLRYLLDEAVAGDDTIRLAELPDSRNWHGLAPGGWFGGLPSLTRSAGRLGLAIP